MLTFLVTILAFSTAAWAEESFSIYLVRHAEKQTEGKNPSLTACGLLRAKQLASLLSKANISNVYSTNYQRTLQTAKPLAKLNKFSVTNYDPRKLEAFALQLKKNEKSVLVVGHSNTTPLLTELLSEQKVSPLTEKDFNFLYQVQFIGEQRILTLFEQPLICKN